MPDSSMIMKTIAYRAYCEQVPQRGKQIIAHYDDEGIIVYQAFSPSIVAYAVAHQRFGGSDYSLNRMSWIKTNFLWMMYRAGWATKAGQERIVAIKLSHAGFRKILEEAEHATHRSHIYHTHENWQAALSHAAVQLQWDPDHDPQGNRQERRAIQLGLKGAVLEQFNTQYILSIEDITPFVAVQRVNVGNYDFLQVPFETIYAVDDVELARKLDIGEQ